MGAILKNINIHGEDLSKLMNYTSNPQKISLIENGLENLLSYAANPEKTTIMLPQEGETSMLVTGVKCNPTTANEEFAVPRNRYREENPEYIPPFAYLDQRTGKIRDVSKAPVTAVHVIQSFEETDIDPRVANAIGVALCERLGVQAVVDTHMNREHIHNHIVINAYMPDGMTKFYIDQQKRIELRRLSDDIQREFGLEITFDDPEIQQRKSHDKSMGHDEWERRANGTSWKDQMRNDILAAKDVSFNKEEFIEVMTDYGYTIEKETDKGIMWKTSSGKKIWDKTLGVDYQVTTLFPNEPTEMTKKAKEEEIITPVDTYSKPISVARYDIDGRRRSNLEMLIRKAIAIIQRVSNYINKVERVENKRYNGPAKLSKMQEALKTIRAYGIEDLDDLEDKLNLAGKNLNTVKQAVSRTETELAYYKTVERMIAEYVDSKTLYDSVLKWEVAHDLHVNKYSDHEIAVSRASLAPMTVKQRSDLFQMMEKHPELRIIDAGKSYENISAIQFREIRDYFRGKGPKPDYLTSRSENSASLAFERSYEWLSQRLTGTPASWQVKNAEALLKEHGFDNIDMAKLTIADIMNINNCYGPNPFGSPAISAEKIAELQLRLQTAGRELNRDQITEDEYKDVVDYLDGKRKSIPNVLKTDVPAPSETDLEKTIKLAHIMMIAPSVPIEKMNSIDVRNLYNWMISQGHDPICTREDSATRRAENKERFHEEIEVETPRKQEILLALRNATNMLAQLGIEPDDIDAIKARAAELRAELKDRKEMRESFSEEYKTLLRLKQQTMYATSQSFLFGSLFDQRQINRMQEEQKEEERRDQEPIIEEPQPKEPEQKKHKIFDTIDL